MRCPTLAELPPPPAGNAGWPWTEQSEQLPETMPNGRHWPKISIVTPSFNQGQFIEETIRSVLLQGYPNLQYIIIDGGSTDNSVEIIRRYEPWLSYWVSELDAGQAQAINKGLAHSTGEIVAWLNSDDVYLPGVLGEAAKWLMKHPEVAVVYGRSRFIDENGKELHGYYSNPFDLEEMLYYCRIPQPSSFIRKWAIEQVDYLDQEWSFIMDYDLWMRIGLRYPLRYFEKTWSYFRRHATSKSITQEVRRWTETIEMLRELFERKEFPPRIRPLRSRVLGHANWHASLAYCQAGRRDEATGHLEVAVALAPNWPLAKVSHNIILTYALQSAEPRKWIRDFFDLLPELTLKMKVARRLALAHYCSHMAFEAFQSKSPGRGIRFAGKAILNNPCWAFDRNLIYHSLVHLLGSDAVERLRRVV